MSMRDNTGGSSDEIPAVMVAAKAERAERTTQEVPVIVARQPTPPPQPMPGAIPAAIQSDGSKSRRVPPNPDRPRLRKAAEAEFAALSTVNAEAYDGLEVVGERLDKLTEGLESGAVVAEIVFDESLIYKIKGIT